MQEIAWDDFMKVDLRVGRILAVEPFPQGLHLLVEVGRVVSLLLPSGENPGQEVGEDDSREDGVTGSLVGELTGYAYVLLPAAVDRGPSVHAASHGLPATRTRSEPGEQGLRGRSGTCTTREALGVCQCRHEGVVSRLVQDRGPLTLAHHFAVVRSLGDVPRGDEYLLHSAYAPPLRVALRRTGR